MLVDCIKDGEEWQLCFQGFTFTSGRVPVEGFVWHSLSAMVYFEMGTMGRLVYVAYPLGSKSGSLEKVRLTCHCV